MARRPWHHARNLTQHLADIVCDTGYDRSGRNHHEPGQKSTLQEILPLSVRPNPELQMETVQLGSSVLAGGIEMPALWVMSHQYLVRPIEASA